MRAGSDVRALPSRERLLALFNYNRETGALTWREREDRARWWNARYMGTPALSCPIPGGYLMGRIDGVAYYSHRVIWKMETGEEPPQIDHDNGKRSDNRFVNLAASSPVENAHNVGLRSDNTTGRVGIYRHKKSGRWKAQIRASGTLHHLGYFATADGATRAREAAELRFGFHPNHGAAR